MKWKKETNLVIVGEEGLKVFEIQVRTGELLAHDFPNPFEGSGIGDVGAIRTPVRPASKQANKPSENVDNERSRIAAFGESAKFVLVIENGQLDRILVGCGEVLANKRHELSQTTDSETGHVAVFENATNRIALGVLAVGVLDLVGGENASKVQETVDGELELRRYIVASIDQAQQLRS